MTESNEQHEQERVKDETWFSNYSWLGQELKQEENQHGRD